MKTVHNTIVHIGLFAGLLLGGWTIASAQEPAQEPAAPQADNTKVNQRDRNSNESTADQQKENRSDRDITQQIRKAIVKDKSLSSYAHNVKVITQNGMVTLKEPVRSEDEKMAVAAKAAEIGDQTS